MILGSATPSETEKWARERSHLQYRLLGRTGLTTSQIGFGSYRIDIPNAVHRAALKEALLAGINLIDTSSNYADGGSEQLIGSLLDELISQGELKREAIILVSKGGYLQGQNFALSQTRKAEGNRFPDLVEYGPQLEHCIHPEFLADQIGRSLDRLGCETIDLYLLHNPEYYLGYAKKVDRPLEEARTEYYRRIALAFQHLESEVANGRIRGYGISSNSFPHRVDSYDFTELDQVWEIAQKISPDHHFQGIQLPMNLMETGGASKKNQPNGMTVLDYAQDVGLGVLINRPLNAVVGNNLIRLADLPAKAGAGKGNPLEIPAHIDGLETQEARLQRAIFGIDIQFRTKQEFAATTGAGKMLATRWNGFGTYSNWRDVVKGYLEPRARFAIRFLQTRPELPPEAAEWIAEYEAVHRETMEQITAYYQEMEREMLASIRANVAAVDAAWAQGETLSQQAVRALRSTAGVSCVLVGMRSPTYVSDMLAELGRPIEQQTRDLGLGKRWESRLD